MPLDEFGMGYGDGGFDASPVDPMAQFEEEERKRREEELQRQREQQDLENGISQQPVVPTFADNFRNQLAAQTGFKLPQAGGSFTDNFRNIMGAKEPNPNEVVHKQQIETRADGSQTHKTTTEIPAGKREPGFIERALNYVIPSAQAGELPPQGAGYGLKVPGQPPVAQAMPVAAPAVPVGRTLTPGEEAVPEQQPQQVISGPQAIEAGAGRGQVNPPTVNQQVPVGEPTPQQGGLINNNPGNIMFGPYAQKMGATGKRPNGTAIFPDQATGEAAQHNLLGSGGYSNYSIRDIPQRWAPAGHGNNNPEAYGKALQQFTGFDNDTMAKKYNELTPAEQATYRQAMAKVEHGTASSGVAPNPGIAKFQEEVIARNPGSLGNYGPQGNGVDGSMGPATQAAIAANPDLAQKYGLTAAGARVEQNETPAQKGINAYDAAQRDPMALLKLANDKDMPEFIQKRSREQAYELLHQNKQETEASQKVQELVASGDQNAIARAIANKPKDEKGSYFKAAIMQYLGLTDLAKEEQQKLGAGAQWKPAMSAEGATGLIKYDPQGLPTEGIKADGSQMTAKDLANYASGAAIAQQNKTLQTQAHHSAATAMDGLRKENLAATNRGLPPPYTEAQILQAGKSAYNQTMSVRPGMIGGQGVTGTTANATETNVATTTTPGSAAQQGQGQAPVRVEGEEVPTTKGGILADWKARRVGEDTKAWSKRQEIRPQDVEEAAQQLVKGNVKPSEFTGRGSDFRRLAIVRASEIDPDYSPMRYDTVKDVVKRYTSGKDHETLVNIGTAGNHLLQFKSIAEQTPGNTNVSSWNTFVQNLSKYGNAPEVKSKEAAAEFVAGEMVKAATGAQGSMSERQTLEKRLMGANTPAEWNKVIDDQLKLAHGRYDAMRKNYESSTKRKDFNDLIGLPDEVATQFTKIEGQEAAKKGAYKDKDKEARYQEWKRQQGMK
jgi:hypothetical protein